MKQTYAYTRYTKPKTTDASGSYVAGQVPTFLGVTLNMDDRNRDYRQARIEYPEDRYRVVQGELGHRDMIDRATGEAVILNALLEAGEIVALEYGRDGTATTIRSMAGAPTPEECEKPGPRPCAHCRGTGKVTALVDCLDRSESGVRQINCVECGGLGTMTPEALEWREKGRAMREDRVARGLSLREEAERLGMTARALGDLEWGRRRAEGELV